MEGKDNITLSISTSTMIKAVLIIIGGVLLWVLRDIILVLLTSIVIASFINIVAKRLAKYKINRTLTIIFIYIVSVSALAGIFYLFTPIILDEATDLARVVSEYLPQSSLLANLKSGSISGAKDLVVDISHSTNLPTLVDNVRDLSSTFSGGLFDSLALAFGGIMNLMLIFIISFYLSIQERGIENFLRIILPAKYEDYIVDLWNRSQRKIALWIRGQILLGLLMGILVYLGLSIFGVKYALLLAITAAVFELIPFGFLFSAVPAVILSYVHGDITLALIVTGFYTILQQFENYLLQPLIVQKVVGISPLVVILSLLVGYTLAGFWGILLAIPVVVPLLEFLDDLEKEKISAKSNV